MKRNEDGSVLLTPGEAEVVGLALWSITNEQGIRSFNHSVAVNRGAVLLCDPGGTSTDAKGAPFPNGKSDLDGVDGAFVDLDRGLTPGIF